MSDDGLKSVMFVVIVVCLIACVLIFGCTDETAARRVLRESGYRDVQITGFKPEGCGRGDWYATGFSAVSPSGDHVQGVVCAGLAVKYSTIRLQ